MMNYSSPKLYFKKNEKALTKAFQNVLNKGEFILGNEVCTFEKLFSDYISSKYCVGVNSGTDALVLSLKSAGISHGDEVITTALTAPATILSILQTGATPVIVDVETPTYCISPTAISNAIGSATKAVIPVHLHGYASDMDRITRICSNRDLVLIEDCSHAHGAQFNNKKLGTFGHCAAFSFYPTKNLGCLGDGGAVLTNKLSVYTAIQHYRNYGFNSENFIIEHGMNSRMDELQAAFLNVLLMDLEERNEQRVGYAKKYHHHLSEFSDFLPPIIKGSVYHQFSIRVPNRKKFVEKLKSRGLNTGIHYPFTMRDHPAFKGYCRNTPVAERVVKEFVSLPIQPEILDQDFDKISNLIRKCLNEI